MLNHSGLTSLLTEWRRLTEEEGQAIRNGNWTGLADQQAGKAQLQTEISRLQGLFATVSDPAIGSSHLDPGLEPLVRELLALEARNRDLLAARRLDHQAESRGLAKTTRDLTNMRRAYGRSPNLHWQSYS